MWHGLITIRKRPLWIGRVIRGGTNCASKSSSSKDRTVSGSKTRRLRSGATRRAGRHEAMQSASEARAGTPDQFRRRVVRMTPKPSDRQSIERAVVADLLRSEPIRRLVELGLKAKQIIGWRLAVPSVVGAAVLAGCFTYFVAPPLPVEADQRLPPGGQTLEADMGTPANIDQRPSTRERVAAFELAAEAILKQATADAKVQEASARTDKPAITRPIPLPKSRPIPRQ